MFDFLMVSTRSPKKDVVEIYPKFIITKSEDLMIRGGDFYAIWVEERGLWSTDEQDALRLIDREIDIYAEQNKDKFDCHVRVLHMWDAESGMIDSWHKYCQKQLRDNYHALDESLIFANAPVNKKDYASKRLPYALESGDISAWDRMMSVLYSAEERQKIEWAIGAIVTGDSKRLQKFMVLYGSAGTGKSTVLNIIQLLFAGYFSAFDAKALGSSNNAFALEAFKNNPLVAIQHDGDLSHIEDNTRLNSIVSHELMTVNEKFKSTYNSRFQCFLFMGTNKPVRITDAKSGLIRRLVDVSPTGNKLRKSEYDHLMSQIAFELGAIACHCRDVYLKNAGAYDNYIPVNMMGASNHFYNFVMDSFYVFSQDNGTSLKAAWEMYKTYCDDAKVSYPYSRMIFQEELKNYFYEYKERSYLEDGSRVRNYYSGFRKDRFERPEEDKSSDAPSDSWLMFDSTESVFDKVCKDSPAQYGSEKGTPIAKWENVNSTLSDIDTTKLHYVKPPMNHIVIDLDITDESGNKNLALNMKAASQFKPTYAELSKSGSAIHLHYIYTGDVSKLSSIYGEHIEIKKFTGGSSLRRKLSKCNSLPIASISSGLPEKEEKKLVNFDGIKSEKSLRALIARNLRKEIHPGTKPSVDFIYTILENAYKSNLKYDISDMYTAVMNFAANSTHQSEYCLNLLGKMKFKSEEQSDNSEADDPTIVFFDVEVFPNLFVICWKAQGEGQKVVRMINPKPHDIEELMRHRLIGFNCRRYDNHILYAALMGYTNQQLYSLSQKIVNGQGGFFGEAYNVSYTDIYDFSSKKQSLKKFEIDLGIHHQELGLAWDQPVPEEKWKLVAEYCDNDVIATEAVFNARQADFTARKILADVAGMTVNDTTNSLTTRIIFGKNRKPQDVFNYRNMGEMVDKTIQPVGYDEFTIFGSEMRPIFPGYKYEFGKSTYRGEEIGEGGYVYAEPGIYHNVALLDIASMHPSSIIAEKLFGEEYTQRFADIRDARIAIKHKDFAKARTMLGGALAKYLDDEAVASDLAKALKIAINSVYGLTAAKFDNPFRDIRNVDNIVAKRGALFMVNLKHEVQKRGFTVAHIKTDSIKIPDATQEIIDFVMEYGKMYGYNFEHEATYDRMCLVNDAVYIAKYKDGGWTATGTQFQVPYVFKTLFSKEPIEFVDMCETKSVSTALYLDMNEHLPEDEHNYIFVGKVGSFCPIKTGYGGGLLMCEKDGKYSAATGSKGYRWLESEMVKTLGKEDDIDISYYRKMVDDAIDTIAKYGDFEAFAE